MIMKPIKIDYDSFIKNIRRQRTPDRVHFMELSIDVEVAAAIDEQFGISSNRQTSDPAFVFRKQVELQRFLGYDYVEIVMVNLSPSIKLETADTTEGTLKKEKRSWVEEHRGPIGNWEEFEKYPWPDPSIINTKALEWYDKNLPDDMCIMPRGGGFCEWLMYLMGYETLCYALYEQRDLVQAISDKILQYEEEACKVALQSHRVKLYCGDDDMGFNQGPMMNPADLKHFVLSNHRRLAELTHQAGHPYILHSCGNRTVILEDLIEYVKLDAIHSWQDKIETITEAKKNYGHRLSLLGGIDMDFLCRSSEEQIRKRVRETIEVCQPSGGFCLGTGNTVANYVPLANYLCMMDEGRNYLIE